MENLNKATGRSSKEKITIAALFVVIALTIFSGIKNSSSDPTSTSVKTQQEEPGVFSEEKRCSALALSVAQDQIDDTCAKEGRACSITAVDTRKFGKGDLYRVDAETGDRNSTKNNWIVQLQDTGGCEFRVVGVSMDGKNVFVQDVLH